MAGLGTAVLFGGWFGLLAGIAVGVGARALFTRLAADDSARREARSRGRPRMPWTALPRACSPARPCGRQSRWWPTPSVNRSPVCWVGARDATRWGHPRGHVRGATRGRGPAPVGRVLLRSVESGGALTRSLVACAEQMRYERAGELERRGARSASKRWRRWGCVPAGLRPAGGRADHRFHGSEPVLNAGRRSAAVPVDGCGRYPQIRSVAPRDGQWQHGGYTTPLGAVQPTRR